MTDLRTERLILHPTDVAEAGRIVARRPGPEDRWALGFPFEGDVIGVTAYLQAVALHGDQHPFGHYRITRAEDGLAIGGIGFKGQPQGGSVEIGFGLAPSARGHGYAAEAARALVSLAREHGLSRVVADTAPDNIASQRTLERAGFTRSGRSGDLLLYVVELVPVGGSSDRTQA